MSSIYKRATPSQSYILRVIEGAVKNACDAHPDKPFDRRFAKSVAKRAAGTLTAPASDPLLTVQARVKRISTVNAVTGCWEANGDKSADYGKIKIHGRRLLLHRVAYEAFIGPIPDGCIILHGCDNRRCCNPDHLSIGSHADNASDMVERGRHGFSPLCGELHPRAKLSAPQVLELISANETNAVLAARYGVSESLVQQIRTGKKWKHVWAGEYLPDVLAARALSVKARSEPLQGRCVAHRSQPRSTGTFQLIKRSPLRLLWGWLSSQMRGIKNRGEAERFEAFRDVLRQIDKMERANVN